MVKVACIVNPTSCGGKAGKAVQPLRERLDELSAADPKWHIEFQVTTKPKEAITLGKNAFESRLDFVVVVGGDGTLSEVVNGMLAARDDSKLQKLLQPLPRLLYLAIATGGDFARLGYCVTKPEEVVQALCHPSTVKVDVGVLEFPEMKQRRYFVNVASIGMSSKVCARADNMKHSSVWSWLPGSLIFAISSGLELLQLTPIPLAYRSADDENAPWVETEITTLALCNGRYFGGGMFVAPHASAQDKTLALTIWREGFCGFVTGAPGVWTGGHTKWKSTTQTDACTFELRAVPSTPPNLIFEADGEQSLQLPARVSVGDTISFIVAPKAASHDEGDSEGKAK